MVRLKYEEKTPQQQFVHSKRPKDAVIYSNKQKLEEKSSKQTIFGEQCKLYDWFLKRELVPQ